MNLLEEKNNLFLMKFKPKLKEIGFKGSGVTMHRKLTDLIQIFNFQSSSWNNSDTVSIYLNLGILLPIKNYIEETKLKLLESYSTFSIRTNSITGRNQWYEFTLNDIQFENEMNLIQSDFNDYVIEFYNRYDTIEKCINLKVEFPGHFQDCTPYIALTLIKNGEFERGNNMFNQFINECSYMSNSYRKHLEELKYKLIENTCS